MAAKKEELQVSKKYTYNREDDVYVIPMKHRAKPYVIAGYKVRAIRKALTNTIGTSATAAEVSTKYKISSEDFDALKKAFDLTRDAFPLTDEEVEDNSVGDSVATILEEKRTLIAQDLEKEEWKETLKDAVAWRKFVNKQLDPFATAVDSWTPPDFRKLTLPKLPKTSDEVLVVGLSDLHYGASSNSRYMFQRPDWSTKKTVEAVSKYAQAIVNNTANRVKKFKKVIIVGLGDLIHSVNGKTSRGTELTWDTVREEQFEYALTSLTSLIGSVASVIPVVEVHSVYGNHNYEAEMALFRALECYFRGQKGITFKHYSTRPAAFREGNTVFMLDHGADSIERTYVPTANDGKLQQHVQSIMLQIPEMLVGAKDKLFLMGDKHHWEHIEYQDFQFIMFGTIIGGDMHASVNNLRNRARQSCLVIDDNGLKEVLHVYFD